MPVYSAVVDVTVHRSYTVVLRSGDALDAAGGAKQIEALAQTLTQRELDALCEQDARQNELDNVYTEVVAVREVEEEEPDEEEVVLERIGAEDNADRAWGEWAARDPEAATAELVDLNEQEEAQRRKDEQTQADIEEGRL